MSNQLIPYNEVEQFSKAMAASGYFSDVTSISQAIVKIQAGAEIGLPPFASMTGVHIIKGKPVLGANLIATLIKNDPRYDYRIKTMSKELVEIEFYENGQAVGTSSFDIEQARRSGTGATRPPGKPASMLEMYPENMLFARAMSNGAKWYTPGVFGGMPVYTPDEFDLPTNEDGDIVEGHVVVSEPLPEPKQSQEVKPEPEPKKQPLKPTIAMMNKLHALGTQKFGGEWDDARHELIGKLTDGRTQSSKDLSYDEVVKLAEQIKARPDAEHASFTYAAGQEDGAYGNA